MATNTTNAAAILRPEQVHDLVVRPALAASVASTAATLVGTASHELRIPVVTADAVTAWTAEGAEIAPSDAVFGEVRVVPSKIAGLVILSREAADDTNPAAATAVGASLARDAARDLDAAFLGSAAAGGVTPQGLGSLTGVQEVEQAAAWTNLDAFAEAAALVEEQGANVTAWIASPSTALALAKVKAETGSNAPLLAADPTAAARRTIEGRPLLVSAACAPGIVWGVDKSRTFLVLREDARVDVDRSAYFSSDRVGVRLTMRAGFGFAHPASVAKITVG